MADMADMNTVSYVLPSYWPARQGRCVVPRGTEAALRQILRGEGCYYGLGAEQEPDETWPDGRQHLYTRTGLHAKGAKPMASRESKVTKKRTCRHCRKEYYLTAQQVKDHALVCERVTKLGLVMAGGVTLD